jgi:hypothetical protein
MKAAVLRVGLILGSVLFCFVAGAQSHSDLEVEAMQRASIERIQELSAQLHMIKIEKSLRLSPVKSLAKSGARSQSALSAMGLRGVKLNAELSAEFNCSEPPVRSCVRNCSSRFTDGSCASYSSDYCGPDAACAPNCSSRFTDGSCASYSADYCGPDATCTPDCRSRFSDGSCASYGSDVCN